MTVLTSNRNFGLSEQQFEELIFKLRQGDESLFETVFLSQFRPCLRILIKKYGAPHEEAYDCVMWAMLRVRSMLMEQKLKFGNLESYTVRIAVNRFLKNQGRNKELLTDTLPELPVEDEFHFDDDRLSVLDKAWSKMGDKCQSILKGFYYDKIELKQLSILLEDTSEANTRKRKERCLNELRNLFFSFFEH